ncbi:MAG TPA: type II secretion system protein F [Actinobacteria bacterium]|nr:type II secretion system protein F [Actinomycetota bacterium]
MIRRVASLAVAFGLGPAAPALAQSGGIQTGDPKTWLVYVGAAAAGIALFLLFIILFGRAPGREAALRGRLVTYGAHREGSGGFFSRFRFLRRAAASAEGVARERGVFQMIETTLEQANLPLRPGEAIIGSIGVAIVAGLIVMAVAQQPLLGVVAFVVVLGLAAMTVNVVAARERKKFEAQLPDTLNLISTSLRAGYSLLQAVEAVGAEAPEPTSREFLRAISEIRLGSPVSDALGGIAERMESTDFEWAVLAINIQREVGGNLAEVLQTTAETMLARNRLRREMKALTAEGRISAIVLGALPFFLFGLIWVLNPDYIAPLLTTPMGLGMLGGAFVMIVLGIVWLQKIVTVEI